MFLHYLQNAILILLGISDIAIIVGLLMFVFKVGDDSVLTPLIDVVVIGQMGIILAVPTIWLIKCLTDWKPPMIPLIGSTIAIIPIVIVLLMDLAGSASANNQNNRHKVPLEHDGEDWKKGIPKPTSSFENKVAELVPGWTMPLVFVYNLCGLWLIVNIAFFNPIG